MYEYGTNVFFRNENLSMKVKKFGFTVRRFIRLWNNSCSVSKLVRGC